MKSCPYRFVETGFLVSAVVLAVFAFFRPHRPLSQKPSYVAIRQAVASNPASSQSGLSSNANAGLKAQSDWSIGFGKEFWHESKRPGAGTAPRTQIDLGSVVDRISHAISPASATCDATVQAQTFTVSFLSDGFRLSPHKPMEAKAASSPAVAGQLSNAHPSIDSVPALHPDPGTIAAFRTLAVRRGEQNFLEPAQIDKREPVVCGNTFQILQSKEAKIVEHYETRSEGVSVTWFFGKEPPGHGDVEIDFVIAGLTHLTQSSAGHHFADSSGNSRIRIGHVAAVDSKGTRWSLEMAYESDSLKIRVPANLLSSAVYPLAIDPLIGPEFGINQPIAFPVSGSSPAVASNGRDYLLAWHISVRQPSERYLEQIRATRVNRDGMILDPVGILLASGEVNVSFPSVASDGHDFLVTWSDSRDWDHDPSLFTLLIYGGRVSASGQALDPNGILLSRGVTSSGYYNSVAGNSNGYLVVWEDTRNRGTNSIGISDIYGARIGLDGAVLDGNGIAICTAPDNQTGPAVAANGQGFLVAWTDMRGKISDPYVRWDAGIFAALVGNNGAVQQPNGFLVNDGTWAQYNAAVACDGENFFVAWQDERNAQGPPWPGNTDIFGARVSSAGVVLDPAAISICTASGTQSKPAVAFDGTRWVVAWSDARNTSTFGNKSDIFAALVNTDGSVPVPGNWRVEALTSTSPDPRIAANGNDLLLAWAADREIYRPFATGIMGARIRNSALLDAEPRLLSIQAADENLPDIACNGSSYLVVWNSSTTALYDNSTDILATRLSLTGEVIDPSGIVLSALADVEQLYPRVAANGQDFFVAWQDNRNRTQGRDIYGTMVTGAGQVVSSNGVAICTASGNQYTPLVAASGDQFLVAWMDFRQGNNANVAADVYGARISSAGTILDANGFAISAAAQDQYIGGLAGNGSHWLVVWSDSRLATNYPWYSQLLAARVDAGGHVMESDGFPIDAGSLEHRTLGVAARSSEFYVTWFREPTNSESATYVMGTRVTDDGLVATSGGAQLTDAGFEPSVVSIAGIPDGYLISWHVSRHDPAHEEDDDYFLQHDLVGIRVRPDGSVRDASPMQLSDSPNLFPPVRLASNGYELMLTYSAPAPINRRRIMAARLDLGLPSPWQEQTIAQSVYEGSAVIVGNIMSIVGVGSAIGGREDSCHFVYQILPSDGEVLAHFVRWTDPAKAGKAGVMLRADLSPGSMNAFLGITANNGIVFERRKAENARAWELRKRLPQGQQWLRLVRRGKVITAWTSVSGAGWNFVWVARVPMTGPVLAGIAATAQPGFDAAQAEFDSVQINSTSPAQPSNAADPSLGIELADVRTSVLDGGAQLLVYGVPGTDAVLEGSSDLSHWSELVRFTCADEPEDFEEEAQPVRFYRARLLSP